jgi:hypothetical protein
MMKISLEKTVDGECDKEMIEHGYNIDPYTARGTERSLANFNHLPFKCDLKD